MPDRLAVVTTPDPEERVALVSVWRPATAADLLADPRVKAVVDSLYRMLRLLYFSFEAERDWAAARKALATFEKDVPEVPKRGDDQNEERPEIDPTAEPAPFGVLLRPRTGTTFDPPRLQRWPFEPLSGFALAMSGQAPVVVFEGAATPALPLWWGVLVEDGWDRARRVMTAQGARETPWRSMNPDLRTVLLLAKEIEERGLADVILVDIGPEQRLRVRAR